MIYSNADVHPEAWTFYVEQARNMTKEPTLIHLGKYRIPRPNADGTFIYANNVIHLWNKFIDSWYADDLNSPSVRGKIQYIVNNF